MFLHSGTFSLTVTCLAKMMTEKKRKANKKQRNKLTSNPLHIKYKPTFKIRGKILLA